MSWFFVAIIGLLVGAVMNILARRIHMPEVLAVGLGMVGALIGAGLNTIVGTEVFGPWSFYLSALFVSVCLLGGAVLTYSIVSGEGRAAS